MTKVFVSKYALSAGISEMNGEVRQGDSYQYIHEGYNFLVIGRDCFLTEEEARQDAEKKRQTKIKSLRKSILKMEALSFAVAP